MADRRGLHYEGQYIEVEVRDRFPVAFFVDDTEIEPSLDMVRRATSIVRGNDTDRPADAGQPHPGRRT